MASPIILCDCAGMANDRWLECRAHGPKGDIPYTVGGSDVAAIFGLSPWTTPLELWLIKKGKMKAPVKSNQDQLEMGHLLEPIAAHWFEKKTGNLVTDDTFLYQHADHPYALANIDRRYTRQEDGEPGILECKSCTYHKAEDWADDAIPLYYELQLRFYLAVLDVEYGAFSCVWGNNPGTDLAMPEIIRDKAKEDMIFERLEQWVWSLEHDKPPTLEDVKPKLALESLARIYGASLPGLPTVKFSPKYERSLRQIALLQEKIASCNQEIKSYKTTPVLGFSSLAKRLREKGLYLAGVPGFYKNQSQWTLKIPGRGILIPVRDVQGQIQGLQVRLDNVEKRKFRWLSSAGLPEGCGAKTWVHLAGEPRPLVLLTEGPMKADVIHFLTGQTVLAVAGVNSLSQLSPVLEELRAAGMEKVMTAFDMDYLINPHVRAGQENLNRLLEECRIAYGTYLWDPRYKGLDDYIWGCLCGPK